MEDSIDKNDAVVESDNSNPPQRVNDVIEDKNEIVIRPENETRVIMKEITDVAPHLLTDNYKEHLSLLYLMCKEGSNREFLNKVFCNSIGLKLFNLDIIHCATLAVGENFSSELLGKDISIDEFRSAVVEHSALKKYSTMESIQEVSNEIQQVKAVYDLHIKSLEQMRNEQKTLFDERLQDEKANFQDRLDDKEKLYCTEKKNIEESCRTQINILNGKLEEATKNLDSLKGEYDKLKADYEIVKSDNSKYAIEREIANAKASRVSKDSTDSEKKKKKGLFKIIREFFSGEKEFENSREFILSLISNPQFSAQQLEVIKSALDDNLPPEELAKVCDPKIPVANMKMMINYMKRSHSNKQENDDITY